jgi:glycine cleavage system aminomethyltransferase T
MSQDQSKPTNRTFEFPIFHSPWATMDFSVKDYGFFAPPFIYPYHYGSWQDECMSYKKGCSIFAGLTLCDTGYATGPDVIQLLSDCTSNSYANFPIGKSKHCVLTDDNGNIIQHGLALRIAEDKVWLSSIFVWVMVAAQKKDYKVSFEQTTDKIFNFQMGGPRTLEVLETATGDDLHDIPFLGFRNSSINGKTVRIYRMTMVGTLGYEVHGDTADALEIYETIVNAGKSYGLKKVGWLCYASNVAECGMPQEKPTFATSVRGSEFYMEGFRKLGFNVNVWPAGHTPLCGSSASDNDISKYYRNPIEINWGVSVQFDHDFPGKAILQELKANPKRKTATLVWNTDDVLDIFASNFRSGEPYKWMNYPVQNYNNHGYEQDNVYNKNGKLVGYSTSSAYSNYSRNVISLGTLDVECLEIGTEVIVLWGNPGQPQKEVRAVVGKYPYIDLPLNIHYDIGSIPHINKK